MYIILCHTSQTNFTAVSRGVESSAAARSGSSDHLLPVPVFRSGRRPVPRGTPGTRVRRRGNPNPHSSAITSRAES